MDAGCELPFCERFEISAANGKQIAVLSFADATGFKTGVDSHAGGPFVRFALEPFEAISSRLQTAQVYSIAGMLKDMSLLHPGLATRLSGNRLRAEIRYCYQDGMQSFLFEEDHARFGMDRDCFVFAGDRDGMRVDGCLRFLHAGVPHVRNYVNFHPTQGGAHLEGLGEALREVFPDAKRGCRPLMFITNSNTGTHVHVPHSFIGVMHLRMKEPHFDGPTRDILLGDEVRDFVKTAALAKLKEWDVRGREIRESKHNQS